MIAGSAATLRGDLFDWDADATTFRKVRSLMIWLPSSTVRIFPARVLRNWGDSVTTDHISPAGAIKADSQLDATSPITVWSPRLQLVRIRRGNHEVMSAERSLNPLAESTPRWIEGGIRRTC